MTKNSEKDWKKEKRKRKLFRLLKKYLPYIAGVIALIGFGAWAAVAANGWIAEGGKVTTISKSSLEKVIEINDLSTLDYTYNSITDVMEEEGDKVKYHVAYEGVVTAGIDISQVEVSVDEEKKLITVELPEAMIQTVSVDMGSMEFIFENKKYETETVSQEAYTASVADLEKKARAETTLLSMAKANAIDAMTALITPWVEQVKEEYTVEIR